MSTELRTLILRLDGETRAAMERAAELCAQQTHFSVDPEHLLAELLSDAHGSLAKLLDHFRVALPRTQEQLQQALARLKRGNGRTPVLSEHLPLLLEQAWVIASMQLGESQISAACVLLAALESGTMRGLLLESAPNLLQIPRETLRKELRALSGAVSPPAPAAPSHPHAQPNGSDAMHGQRMKTPALDQYTIDLTAQAAGGALDPVVGRDEEIRQVIEVLMLSLIHI